MISASFPPSPGERYHQGSKHTQNPRTLQDTGVTPSSSSTGLPKIAAGRSALSAKKLWKDHSNIDICTAVEKGRRSAPEEQPLPVSKNPKPLYRRSVGEVKPFRILHSNSNLTGIRNTKSLPSLYAQMTFLANAVRNTDGTTSYKGMCKKRRHQTVPGSAPGRLQDTGSNDLHWASAERPIPRMLLPTAPGPNSTWYAWKSPREPESPEWSPRKERDFKSNIPVIRRPRSDSGIDSQASFHHSIAQKRGQMVVSYKHNGRQLYSLVNPPPVAEPARNQGTGKSKDYSSGSSVITSSYATSYTDSSRSQESFSVKGVRRGVIRTPSAKDAKIISQVDGAQETTHVSDGDQDRESNSNHDSQEQECSTAQDSNVKKGGSDVKVGRSKGVHFAEGVEAVEDNQVYTDESEAGHITDKTDADQTISESSESRPGSNLSRSDLDQSRPGSNQSSLDSKQRQSNQIKPGTKQTISDSDSDKSMDTKQNRPDSNISRSSPHYQSRPGSHQSRLGSHQSRSDSHQSRPSSQPNRRDSHQSRPGSHQIRPDSHQRRSNSPQNTHDSKQTSLDSKQSKPDSNQAKHGTDQDGTVTDQG